MPFVIEGGPYESDISIDEEGGMAVTTVEQLRTIDLTHVDPERDRFAIVMPSKEADNSALRFRLKNRVDTQDPYLELDIQNSDAICIRSLLRLFNVNDPAKLSAQCVMMTSSAEERKILLYTPIMLHVEADDNMYMIKLEPYAGCAIRLESHTLDA